MRLIYIMLSTILFFVSCGDKTLNNNVNSPPTTIYFSIPYRADVIINIYPLHDDSSESINNILVGGGTYISPESLKYIFTHTGTYEAGSQSFKWDRKDYNGKDVPPGWYRIVLNILNDSFSSYKDIFIKR